MSGVRSTEETGQQRNEGGTNQGDATTGHKLSDAYLCQQLWRNFSIDNENGYKKRAQTRFLNPCSGLCLYSITLRDTFHHA